MVLQYHQSITTCNNDVTWFKIPNVYQIICQHTREFSKDWWKLFRIVNAGLKNTTIQVWKNQHGNKTFESDLKENNDDDDECYSIGWYICIYIYKGSPKKKTMHFCVTQFGYKKYNMLSKKCIVLQRNVYLKCSMCPPSSSITQWHLSQNLSITFSICSCGSSSHTRNNALFISSMFS